MKKRHYLTLLTVILARCAQIHSELPPGPNRIVGRAALTTGQYTQPCEDVTIVLATKATSRKIEPFLGLPRNGFVREPFFREMENDPDYARVSRNVGCGADGAFQFRDLPGGTYYIVARATWLLGHAHHGGFLLRKIDVSKSIDGLLVMDSRPDA
jgi:hypothetical protein